MFLRSGVVLMTAALVLVVATTVAFAASRSEYGVATRAAPESIPESIAQTIEEPEDTSQPWLNIPDPKPVPKMRPIPKPRAETEPRPKAEPKPAPKTEPVPKPELRKPTLKPEPRMPAPKPTPKPEPRRPEPKPEQNPEPKPKPETSEIWRSDLPAWAVMGITVPDLGIHDAPVRSSDGQAALDAGVVHVPGTSLPWDSGSQRNVYVAGHRLGWAGTGSFRIFYRLNELRRGDEVVIEDRRGRAYHYRVTERLVVNPGASWVTREVPGRDMLSLQTCTPIPTFEKRLIIRAERVEDHDGKEQPPESRKN